MSFISILEHTLHQIHTCFAEKNSILLGQNAPKNTRNPTYTGGNNGSNCIRLTEFVPKMIFLRFLNENSAIPLVNIAIFHSSRRCFPSFFAILVIEFAVLTP